MPINNFEEFRNYLKEQSPTLQDVRRRLENINLSQINPAIVKILQDEENKKNITPPQELQELQQFWMNEKGHTDDNSQRIGKIDEALDLSFKYLEQAKGIEKSQIAGLQARIDNFKVYLKRHANEQNLPGLMQQFCQYVSFLSIQNTKEKIIECLREFPPSNNYLLCLPGTAARMEEQIRKLIFPREIQPFTNAYNLALAQGAETLIPLVKDDIYHQHLPAFLEYSFSFKPGSKIADQNYHTPRADILPNELWKVFLQFPAFVKSFLVEQYENYNGAIALFAEYKNLQGLLDAIEDTDNDDLKKELEQKYESLIERLKDLGFENGAQGIASVVNGEMVWNWNVIAGKLQEFQLQDFNKFIANFSVEKSPSDDAQMSDAFSEDSDDSVSVVGNAPQPLLKIKAKDFAKDLLSSDLEKQKKSLEALWFLSYLENHNSSCALFMDTIYELGERYYKAQRKAGKVDGLSADNNFQNAKIFLKSIKDKIPEEQKFKIDDIAGTQSEQGRINIDRFKIYAHAVAYQHKNYHLFPDTKYFSDKKPYFMKIALDMGFENLAEKLLDDFSIDKSPNERFSINAIFGQEHLLCRAVRNGHRKLAKKLLDLGADVNCKNPGTGRAALSYAAGNGDVKMIQLLTNASINLIDNAQKPPLYYAILNGHTEAVKELIKKGADFSKIEIKFSNQVSVENQEKIKEIIGSVISIFESVKNNDTNLFEKLTSGLEDDLLKSYISCRDKFDKTLTYRAAENGNIQILEKLVKIGFDVNSSDSPLVVAANNGHFNAVEFFIERGANKDQVDFLKQSALHKAVQNNHFEIAKILLKSGSGVNNQDIQGEAPLDLAVANENERMVRLLMENGANIRDFAVGKKQMIINNNEIKNLLLKTHKLFSAIQSGNVEEVKTTIAAGALVTAKNSSGVSILDLARNAGNADIIKTIEEKIIEHSGSKRKRGLDSDDSESEGREEKRQEVARDKKRSRDDDNDPNKSPKRRSIKPLESDDNFLTPEQQRR